MNLDAFSDQLEMKNQNLKIHQRFRVGGDEPELRAEPDGTFVMPSSGFDPSL